MSVSLTSTYFLLLIFDQTRDLQLAELTTHALPPTNHSREASIKTIKLTNGSESQKVTYRKRR